MTTGGVHPEGRDTGGPTPAELPPPPAPAAHTGAERAVLRLARPYLGRLVGAGLLAAATEFAGLALMATATWLLMSAAGRPPLDRLTVAIVAVRALAISRGVFRYTERLAGHDAVLRMITDVRARVFATLAARRGPAEQRSGDALSRLVSDVEAVQDLLLRVLVPGAAAALVSLLAVGGAALVSPPAAGVLAVGLLVAGVALPVLATALTRRAADEVAPLRGALATDAVDLTHGAADLAAFGATGYALRAATDRADRLARLERRLARTGFAVDAAGVLVAGLTAAGVVLAALRAGVDGVLVGVLAVGTLAAVEIALALVGAARQRTQLRADLDRVATLLDTPPAPTAPDGGATVAARAGHDVRFDGVTVRYREGAAPALDGVDLDLPAGRRVAVVGPSGAGKSTLAAVLTGAVHPDAGRVTLDGVTCRRTRPRNCPGPSAGCSPRRTSSTPPSGTTCCSAGPPPVRRSWPPPPGPPACSTGYASNRTAGTRWSARRAVSSPAGSGSGSPWPGRCSPPRPCWCWTSPPKGSIRPPPTRCSPPRWPPPRPGTRCC